MLANGVLMVSLILEIVTIVIYLFFNRICFGINIGVGFDIFWSIIWLWF